MKVIFFRFEIDASYPLSKNNGIKRNNPIIIWSSLLWSSILIRFSLTSRQSFKPRNFLEFSTTPFTTWSARTTWQERIQGSGRNSIQYINRKQVYASSEETFAWKTNRSVWTIGKIDGWNVAIIINSSKEQRSHFFGKFLTTSWTSNEEDLFSFSFIKSDRKSGRGASLILYWHV